jgi:hypothetical protein
LNSVGNIGALAAKSDHRIDAAHACALRTIAWRSPVRV